MYINKSSLRFQISGILISIFLMAGAVQAERTRAPGYAISSSGSIMRDGAGECVHTSNWTKEMAVVVGCDGVVLKAPVELDEGGSTNVAAAFIIPSASLFAFNSAELAEEGKQSLEDYRAKIEPELAQAFAGVIIGYSDNRGNANYNIELSKRRAESVRDFLIAGGASAQKLRVVGRGAKDPIASNDTAEGRAENRRVEVLVFGEARALDIMRFPSVALFSRKSSELSLRGKKLLDENKGVARSELTRAVYIEVIGHTDDVGDKKENQKLSEQRAASVRDNLINAGVSPNIIMTVGAGASQPIASNQTEEGRAQNRRVEVLVLGRTRQ